MQIEDNTNSLNNDFKALQHYYNELRVSLKFSQAKIEDPPATQLHKLRWRQWKRITLY